MKKKVAWVSLVAALLAALLSDEKVQAVLKLCF